ncbi:hypothetical protein GCM10007874_08330 [Labrys miyagiensis]|uniref:Uncharacterized protein n=1 Tax=Labrys miyagiensis TaxID=346912 RepID=A0ABQ6CBZ8_9HYPH|nr:hypothetical protein GCM10007874_08330 [Labrys miyagiensis]
MDDIKDEIGGIGLPLNQPGGVGVPKHLPDGRYLIEMECRRAVARIATGPAIANLFGLEKNDVYPLLSQVEG